MATLSDLKTHFSYLIGVKLKCYNKVGGTGIHKDDKEAKSFL